ncbi:MAG: hypothetical protein AAF490_08980 [Chloroflexota bacterium]
MSPMYRKPLGLLIVFIALGSAFFVLQDPDSANVLWYEGGTLHQSTVSEWITAPERDQLATAADWVTAFDGFGAPEEIWPKAHRLRDCINNTAVSSPTTTQTHTIATSCHQN